jgi:hypothetical protein
MNYRNRQRSYYIPKEVVIFDLVLSLLPVHINETRLNAAWVKRKKSVDEGRKLLSQNSGALSVNEWIELVFELILLLHRKQRVFISGIGWQAAFNWFPVSPQATTVSYDQSIEKCGPTFEKYVLLPKVRLKVSSRIDTNYTRSDEFDHLVEFCNIVLQRGTREKDSPFCLNRRKVLEDLVGRV